MAASTPVAVRPQKGSSSPWRWFYIFLGVVVTSIVAFNVIRPITVLPRITLGPGYSFTNQDGRRLTSEDFRGRLTLYTFTYTRCGADCPQTAAQLAALHDWLEQAAPTGVDVALVTISLDPEYDSPAVLADFTGGLPVGDDGRIPWHFLSGDPMRTKYVVGNGFSLYYAPQPDESDPAGYAVYFEPRTVLVDGWGIIRAEYVTAVPDTDIILRDINLVAQEARNSKGSAKIAYEAAHLFLCYPR